MATQQVSVRLTGSGTWVAPSNLIGTVLVRAIGGGGGGARPSGVGTPGLGGAGGGAYSAVNALSVTPGQTCYYQVGAGGVGATVNNTAGGDGGSSWFNKTSNAAPTSTLDGVLAAGGQGALLSSSTVALGGAASSGVGDVTYSGGQGGGPAFGGAGRGNGGGGSAASNLGDGYAGGQVTGSSLTGGGGGGGVRGAGVPTFDINGGRGGANYSGAQGPVGDSDAGTNGSQGSGGAGGAGSSTGVGFVGGSGGAGQEYTLTNGELVGSGGGAGAPGGQTSTSSTATNGSNGGAYGGGASSGTPTARLDTGTSGTGGTGGAGTILLTYTVELDRYWVGGSGNWSDTSHWSTTSGGTPGASVPNQNLNAIFDANSNTGTSAFTVTIDGARSCNNFDCSAIDGVMTIAASASNTFTVYGSYALKSGSHVVNYSGEVIFAATTTGKTIRCGGYSPTTNNVTFNGVGGEWTLQDQLSLTASGSIRLYNGTLNTNSQVVRCNSVTIDPGTAVTLTLGTTWIECGGSGQFLQIINNAPTITATTGGFKSTYTGTAAISTTVSSNTSRNLNVWIAGATGANKAFTAGAGSYGKLDFTGAACVWSGTGALSLTGLTLSSGVTRTYTGALTFSGGSGTITSNGITLASAITVSGAFTYTFADAFTTTSTISQSAGTISFGANTITCTTFTHTGTATKTVSGTGTIVVTGSGTIFASTTGSALGTGDYTVRSTTTATSAISTSVGTGTSNTSYFNLWISGATGAKTFTLGTGTYGKIDFTGATCTFAGTGAITVRDDITLDTNVTRTFTGAITLNPAAATILDIKSAGKTWASNFTISQSSGRIDTAFVRLADDFTTSGSMTLNNGAFHSNGFAATASWPITASNIPSGSSNTTLYVFGTSGIVGGTDLVLGASTGNFTTIKRFGIIGSTALGSLKLDTNFNTGSVFFGTGALECKGDLIFSQNTFTMSYTGTISFTAGSSSIDTLGVQLSNIVLNASACTLRSDLNCGAITMAGGNFLTISAGISYNVTCTTFSVTDSTCQLILGSSVITCTAPSGGAWLTMTGTSSTPFISSRESGGYFKCTYSGSAATSVTLVSSVSRSSIPIWWAGTGSSTFTIPTNGSNLLALRTTGSSAASTVSCTPTNINIGNTTSSDTCDLILDGDANITGVTKFTLSSTNTTGNTFLSTGTKTITEDITISSNISHQIILVDNFSTSKTFAFTSAGWLNCNSYNLSCSSFNFSGSTSNRVLDFSTGTHTFSGNLNLAFTSSPATTTLIVSAATFVFSGSAAKTFTYNTSSGPTTYTYNAIDNNGTGILSFSTSGTTTYINTIKNSTPNATFRFESGKAYFINTAFLISGTFGNLATIESTTSGSRHFLIWNGEGLVTIDVQYTQIKDSSANSASGRGVAKWQALISNGNIDQGNNTGWIFGALLGNFLAFFFK